MMHPKNENEVIEGKRNLIEIGADGVSKTYSFPKKDYLKIFCSKARKMETEFKASNNHLAGFPKN